MEPVVVEEVDGGKALARFVELPQALHGQDPRFAPPVMAWERARVDRYRNPYLDAGDVQLFIARRGGRPAGRIAAHRPGRGGEQGRFGFWATVADERVAAALVDRARAWLAERGCTTMRGPWSFEQGDEPGLLVDGFDAPGTTGRPWRPAFEAELLEAQGAEVLEETATWRWPLTPVDRGPWVDDDPVGRRDPLEGTPVQAGPYADPRLVLPEVAAVPDLAPHLRASRLRGAWQLARRARLGDWEGCTVVRCDGDPAVAVPAIAAAAAGAGYRWMVAPWSADPSPAPETRHRTYVVPLGL